MAGTRRKSLKTKKMCDQCKIEIKEDKEDNIECDKCAKRFHSQCTRLDKRQFEHLLNNENEIFTCHICEGGEGEIKNYLLAIKTQLSKLTDIQEAINFMSKQYDDILKGVVENKKRLNQVEKENRLLKNEVKDLKSSVKMLNDIRVKNDCIVSGMNVPEGVSAVDSVIELSKSVGVDLAPESINEAYFIRNNKNVNNKSSNTKKMVVVKFSTKEAKGKLMMAKAKLKETESTSSVFINDFLSKETLNLLNYARSLKNAGYMYVYARGGRVFYKRSDISRPPVVRCEEDVDELLLQATTTKPWKRRSMVNNETADKVDDSDDECDEAAHVSP